MSLVSRTDRSSGEVQSRPSHNANGVAAEGKGAVECEWKLLVSEYR